MKLALRLFRDPWFLFCGLALVCLMAFNHGRWSAGLPRPSNLTKAADKNGQVALLYTQVLRADSKSGQFESAKEILILDGDFSKFSPGQKVSLLLDMNRGVPHLLRWQVHARRGRKFWLSLLGLAGALVYLGRRLSWNKKEAGLCLTL